MLTIQHLSAGVLQDICFTAPAGSCSAICGPSGGGKTTLLNAIAGNLPYSGNISLGGYSLDTLPGWRRPCRYLNQQLWLFPYLTVMGNLLLAEHAAHYKGSHAERSALLERLGIAHLARRYPHQISGGEQQRAALARALITHPPLLLLDEPFSSLDWETRTQLWTLFCQLRQQYAMTTLLVTHEPREAAALADSQWSLQSGKLCHLPAEDAETHSAANPKEQR